MLLNTPTHSQSVSLSPHPHPLDGMVVSPKIDFICIGMNNLLTAIKFKLSRILSEKLVNNLIARAFPLEIRRAGNEVG